MKLVLFYRLIIIFEFFLNVFSLNSLNLVTYNLSLKGLEPATSCVRDQDATTVSARNMSSLNWLQFMLQRLSDSLNSLNSMTVLHLGKTALEQLSISLCHYWYVYNKKTYGYDKINNCLLKELHPVIISSLNIAFNKSLEEGVFPYSMKNADTVPSLNQNVARTATTIDQFPCWLHCQNY